MKKIIHKLIKIFKDKDNLPIIGLGLIVLVVSLFMIGILKTILLITMVAILIVIVKYGGIIVTKRFHKSSPRSEPRKLKKKTKKLLNYLGIGVLILGILGLIAGAAFAIYIVLTAPKFDPKNLYRKEATTIYDSNNQVVAKIGRELRDKITYDDMPQVFIDAIVATEDSRFLQHNGFDLPRFLKASLGQLTGNSGAGGGSTITMQVSKNNFTSTKQTITRKFTDIYVSIFEIEKHYTKEEILEFYVNAPYLGNNSYGVAEASRNYFGKEIKDLNLSEASLLAGIFNAPGSYDPTVYPDRATARRKVVLSLMKRHGYINAEEEKIANAIPVPSLLKNKNASSSSRYQGYIDVVVAEVIKKTENDPYNVPMKIYTNLIKSKQDNLNDVLAGKTYKWENSTVQAGVAVTDVNTGAIVAIGNGRNRTGERLFNYATSIKRQIGSTAKPIFDYGPGIEYNNWSTGTLFLDDTYSYSNGVGIKNFDNGYQGIITMRNAIAGSRNIPALKAFQHVDNAKIVEFATSLGMTPEISDGHIHEAHAIGGFTGTSPLQMAAAYSAFANGGYYLEPYTVNKIEYLENGKALTYSPKKKRVMSDSTAYMIADVLHYAVDSGKVSGGRVSGVEVAAKTGTTNYDKKTIQQYHLPSSAIGDLWYTGFSPKYAIGMWYGYEKISSDKYIRFGFSTGYRDRLFTALAKAIFDKDGKKFEMPKSVSKVEVEKDTAPLMLPSQYTPANMRISELFVKGTEPTDVSPRFDQLSNPKGLDISKSGANVTITWNKVNTPDTVTPEYLDMIKGHEEKWLNTRNNYNLNNLGTIGYNVYLKNSLGNLSLLGFTTNTSFTDTPTSSGNLTYVVRTCYTIFKSNQSSGSEITLSNNENTIVISLSLKGSQSITVPLNSTSYTDEGVNLSILENGTPVTSLPSPTITTKLPNGTTVSGVAVNTAIAGLYEVTYTVTYKDKNESITRSVHVQ